MASCTCNPEDQYKPGDHNNLYDDCPFVSCDNDCRALEDPQSEPELRATLAHYREHGYLGGCSHGS
jgi:hypothetical protein